MRRQSIRRGAGPPALITSSDSFVKIAIEWEILEGRFVNLTIPDEATLDGVERIMLQ